MTNPNIQVEELILGEGTIIDPKASIRGINGPAKRFETGDHCYIGESVQIICDEVRIGDFCKIHHHTNIHGYEPVKIGHNAWIGQYCVLDSIGGLTIGNNCGIGAHSQIWSHIKYGDTLAGCQFNSQQHTKIGDDVWFAGHCIVSPITASDRSMALVGSVIVDNMEYNQVYGGSPAKPIEGERSKQFLEVSLSDQKNQLEQHLTNAGINKRKIKIIESLDMLDQDTEATTFIIKERVYTKKRSPEEIAFIKYLLPEKAKFTPLSDYQS